MKHVLHVLQGHGPRKKTTGPHRAGDPAQWGSPARWGDPVLPDAPAFDVAAQTREAQEKQYGYDPGVALLMPLRHEPLGQERALLVANHDAADAKLATGRAGNPSDPLVAGSSEVPAAELEVGLAATGLSVVEVERVGQSETWQLVSAGHRPFNRRVTGTTPLVICGPAAGHPLLRTAADPTGRRVLGTLDALGIGSTPWQTTLHGEGEVDQYFDANGPLDPAYAEASVRYGLPTAQTSDRSWSRLHVRFDLSRHPHEANRFGWVVELDPYDPDATPRKRTMLGRFVHGKVAVAVAPDGRAVVDLGDDDGSGFRYWFVSRDRQRTSWSAAAHRHNMGLLDHGTLYVEDTASEVREAGCRNVASGAQVRRAGRVSQKGTAAPGGNGSPGFDRMGGWTPLTTDEESFVPGMSVAEVLVTTRLAVDRIGSAAAWRRGVVA